MILFVALLLGACSAGAVVHPPCGPIVGLSDTAFLGIPFATAKRFEKPVPVPPWTSPLRATLFGPSCPQGPTPNGSEDCLNLNVWLPANNGTRVAVMVWIYGGGFNEGSDADRRLAGADLARAGGVVVVSANYRLGPFGWLAGLGFGGNYGVFDQVRALEWVQQNIAAFGGDPGRVTIFGQSAGAMSVNVHMTSPPSWPLFARAIAESPVPGLEYRDYQQMEVYALELAAATGCARHLDVPRCLRQLPVEVLVNASSSQTGFLLPPIVRNTLHWMPVIDGVNVLGTPRELMRRGRVRPNTPYVVGTCSNESYTFVEQLRLGAAEYMAALLLYFGEHAAEVAALYPAATPDLSLARISTDLAFSCPVQEIGASLPATARLYLFSANPSHDPLNPPWCWGNYTCHAAELSYIFRERARFTPAEDRLSRRMQQLWTSFARGELQEAEWPTYAAGGQLLQLDTPAVALRTGYLRAECQLLNRLAH